MSNVFFRNEQPSMLENSHAGPFPSPLWLIGAGPSLRDEDIDAINASPAPKFCVNLAGCNEDGKPPLIRPNFWTAYDSTCRFHRSIYLDPGVTKFIRKSRKNDIIPETPYKIHQAPNTHFFESEYRPYERFLDASSGKILDCQDTFIQAIDIAYRLGFRKIFMVGVELAVLPTQAQLDLAEKSGVEYDMETLSTAMEKGRGPLLRDFDQRCLQKGMRRDCNPGEECDNDGKKRTILDVDRPRNYSMDETRKWQTTIRADEHYYRTTQYLRLSVTNLALSGLELVCCTSPSRLADYFGYTPVDDACEWIHMMVGNPSEETCLGKYEEITKPGAGFMPMKDFPAHGIDKNSEAVNDFHKKTDSDRLAAFRTKIDEIPEEQALSEGELWSQS